MLRRVPLPLALLLAVAALLVLAWTFTTTPLQGPDEPEHFGYAQQLFTRFVDQQGQTVLESVRGRGAAGEREAA